MISVLRLPQSLRSATQAAARPRHLRLVTEVSPRRRLFTVAVVGVFVLLLGVALAQTFLAQNQLQYDRLSTKVDEAEARYQRLRLRTAELEAPARIVAAAQQRLGMVPPPDVTYLSPSGAVAGEMRPPAPAPEPEPDGGGRPGAWATIKPYLGGG